MTNRIRQCRMAFFMIVIVVSVVTCREAPLDVVEDSPASFRVAMIPDTQNYVDYTHQTAAGFALDASDQFIAQMEWIAARGQAMGGDIVFVASVGDVWQHQTELIDEVHASRGVGRLKESIFGDAFAPTRSTFDIEIPKAIEGYELIRAAGIPFGVAPGNHDYDAMWSVVGYPPNFAKRSSGNLAFTPEDLGMLHIGGLNNFRSVFGDDKKFFVDEDWYVSSFRGGANSAQVFEAGGYSFLHLALEMTPDDEVVAWAQDVIDVHPNRPTIISTHDYLDARGNRRANPIIDLDLVDPDYHNSADELFEKLIAPNDEVFLVLCGHEHGQARRVDFNQDGHAIYQILADYQDRGQSGLDVGQVPTQMSGGPVGIGDGWFRLMEFDLSSEPPTVMVRTYSTHYETYSSGLETYALWYRDHEQPDMTDEEFHAADEFVITLEDFRDRFGAPGEMR